IDEDTEIAVAVLYQDVRQMLEPDEDSAAHADAAPGTVLVGKVNPHPHDVATKPPEGEIDPALEPAAFLFANLDALPSDVELHDVPPSVCVRGWMCHREQSIEQSTRHPHPGKIDSFTLF